LQEKTSHSLKQAQIKVLRDRNACSANLVSGASLRRPTKCGHRGQSPGSRIKEILNEETLSDRNRVGPGACSANAQSLDDLNIQIHGYATQGFLYTTSLGGGNVVPILLKTGASNDEFLQAYIGKNDAAYRAGWRSLVFSGQATMPKSLDSDAAVVEFVAHNAGTIGYIGKASPHDGVKVITVK
jgi:hypothetical protein